jgi:hypothetical protein
MNTGTAFRILGSILKIVAVHDLSTGSVSANILRSNGYARFSMMIKTNANVRNLGIRLLFALRRRRAMT